MSAKKRTAASTAAELLLALVRLRARRLCLWLEHLSQSTSEESASESLIKRTLGTAETERQQSAFYRQSSATELGRQAEAAQAALDGDLAWDTLRSAFGLNQSESDLLCLLIALDLDPQLAQVVGFLHGDARGVHGTAWLSERLAGRAPAPFDISNLRAWLLATPLHGGAPERLMTRWEADPVIATALHGGAWRDSLIISATHCLAPAAVSALPRLQPAALHALSQLRDLRDCELTGPEGIGRQTVAAQYCATRSRTLVVTDLAALVGTQLAPLEAITRALRLAAVTGSFAYFRNADAAAADDWQRARLLGIPYLRGVRHPSGLATPIALKPLPIHERLRLWRSLSSDEPPERLHSTRQTPLEIAAVATGRSHYRARPDHALLSVLPTPYEWEDLVLSDDVLGQLRAFESQIRLRWSVYDDWGFARLAHLGLGIASLFGGPSGTGKTMAAQVLARVLGLELLRVDLAGVVNKYVGETEKKLREVFDACEDSNALLLFDEADALFGKRTQVRDAHDRFANIEIDYLLQRIERFDGIAILATNRRQDLDPAFIRRLRFVIEFQPPRPRNGSCCGNRCCYPP